MSLPMMRRVIRPMLGALRGPTQRSPPHLLRALRSCLQADVIPHEAPWGVLGKLEHPYRKIRHGPDDHKEENEYAAEGEKRPDIA